MAKRLVVLEAVGDQFVEGLRRAWDDGDAVLPLDPRLPAPARDAVLAAARPDEPIEEGDALVVSTSGTTGEPKAAVLPHDAVRTSATITSRALGVDRDHDRWLACLPLNHVGGLSVVTRAIATGTPLTVHERFDATAVEQAASDGCTLTSLVPTALARIDPARFRVILVGGQAPPADRPPNVIATYGMTETGGGVVYEGLPLEGVGVRIQADGEIHLRSATLLRCYRDGTDPKLPDGWYPTGDVGELRDGVLSVHGRRDELIITGGENVWPTVVERALITHPEVVDVVIVGRPDPEWGERVVAVVVPRDASRPPSVDELRAWAKQSLPSYAAPSDVEITAALPRTASGKVRRGHLRAR